MKIDDFLREEKFKELDQFLTEEMYRQAGKGLVEKIKNALDTKDEDEARNWFYSPLICFGGKRPYDYCKKGNIADVEEILMHIEHGIFS